nr:TlpA family protein disulfide reductase [Pseudomonadota bacterium]
MVRRFFAITLLAGALTGPLTSPVPALADDFAAHFTATSPPVVVPGFNFEDGKGRQVSLKDFKGRYVLLNIWATWCGPCVKEMGSLDRLTQKLGIHVVPLTEDRAGRGAAEAFYKRHNLTHLEVFVDKSGEAPGLLNANGLPTTLLIDPKGFEIGRVEGDAEWDSAEAII